MTRGEETIRFEPGMIITVELNGEEGKKCEECEECEELRFLIVRANVDGNKEHLSLKAPLARLLGGMAVGDWLWWQVEVPGGELMRVKLIAVEEAKCS